MPDEHTVGLRELRHNTGEVMARVRHGETLDITERGRLIARIVPVQPREPLPVLARLEEAGALRKATRPGYRPPLSRGDGTNLLSEGLRELRDEERW